MTAVMTGVRILEVAEHTFVPAASAVLADWGAEVIKIEHVERGDAMRGLGSTGAIDLGDGKVHLGPRISSSMLGRGRPTDSSRWRIAGSALAIASRWSSGVSTEI